jgi:hypothetical protein
MRAALVTALLLGCSGTEGVSAEPARDASEIDSTSTDGASDFGLEADAEAADSVPALDSIAADTDVSMADSDGRDRDRHRARDVDTSALRRRLALLRHGHDGDRRLSDEQQRRQGHRQADAPKLARVGLVAGNDHCRAVAGDVPRRAAIDGRRRLGAGIDPNERAEALLGEDHGHVRGTHHRRQGHRHLADALRAGYVLRSDHHERLLDHLRPSSPSAARTPRGRRCECARRRRAASANARCVEAPRPAATPTRDRARGSLSE